MKSRTIRAFGLTALLALSGFALRAIPPGWQHVGCWSPYPNCAGSKDVYQDAAGNLWQCRACGTTTNPSPTTCYQSNAPRSIGYWCA